MANAVLLDPLVYLGHLFPGRACFLDGSGNDGGEAALFWDGIGMDFLGLYITPHT